jgi:predicted RNA-binding Zn ribbon-like protein
MDSDWRDGFLFVGNHLSLNFLNTKPLVNGSLTEFLTDCGALTRWMTEAELIPADAGKLPRRRNDAAALGQLRDFREKLRQAVFQIEAAAGPSRAFVSELNSLLKAYPYLDKVLSSDSGLVRGKRFEPRTPFDLFAPLADSVAGLLTDADPSRIRKCSNSTCVLHFYDISKRGTRRWCSMNMCGNRSKVAAYAQRQRG